jgi:hypothetical protein
MLREDGRDKLFRQVLIVIFAISVIANQTVCYTLCRTLKKNFAKFYNKEKYFIIGVTLIMNVSMIARLAALSWRNTIGLEFNDMLDKAAA